jgi:hypothetical protein
VLADFADSMESSSNKVVTSLKAWARAAGSPGSGLSRQSNGPSHKQLSTGAAHIYVIASDTSRCDVASCYCSYCYSLVDPVMSGYRRRVGSGIGRLGAHPFLAFAHLAFCAATIRARPSALIFLRGALVVVEAFEAIGRPRFTGAV